MRRQEFQRGPAAGPSGRHDDVGTVPANLELPGTRVASSLMLQQLLFYGRLFYPFYLVSEIAILHHKYGDGVVLRDQDKARVAMLSIWAIIEPFRLSRGYHGNLREDFPSLLIFFVLSLLGVPLMIYMWIAQFKITSVDRALTVMLIVYVCLNIFFAGHAMRSVLREQGRRFDLAKMTELAHLNL